ncbi:uncharacterized protein V1518DRAFT_416673 [Limtongia smithiae]|uniref:uncharacterized protein n=1 Tax=Limtongia smithiae TaxID=1125753 RepID=UPI0034CF04DC
MSKPVLGLRVSAAPGYDAPATVVAVNTAQATQITTADASVVLRARVQNYHAPSSATAFLPNTSPYFSNPLHAYDQYSIGFTITFTKDTSFDDVLFGNDFDKPIRDSLPYGFFAAYRIFKYMVDPSAEGDLYVDKPYLYGYAVTSVNAIALGAGPGEDDEVGAIEEDLYRISEEEIEADSADAETRSEIPRTARERQKFFLTESNRTQYHFRAGQKYSFDFYNAYLEMGGSNTFAVKLPGYSLDVLKYWDGQPLRYVLKSKSRPEKVYFVLLFELVPEETETDKTSIDTSADS